MFTTIYTSTNIESEDGAKYFATHDVQDYMGTVEEAQQEMFHWVEEGIASTEPSQDHPYAVDAEAMYRAIYIHVFGAGDYGETD